jgi:tetratricopeptide (TPR) repeat protein
MSILDAASAGDIQQATRLVTEGKWLEAQSVCHGVLNREPDHPVAYHLLGVVAFQIDRADIAVGLFRRSLALQAHPDVCRNLGLAFEKLGQMREAVDAYGQALSLDPRSAEAHNAMGHSLAQLGEAEKAIGCFRQALALRPGFRVAAENLLTFSGPAARIGICEAALADRSLGELDRYLLTVHRAVAEWVLGQYDALQESLAAATPLRPPRETTGRAANMRVFDFFLKALVGYQAAKPREFRREADHTLYAIGDSHILSYANTTVDMAGKNYRVQADWLLPDQAWKFAEGKSNRTVAAFEHAVLSLPHEALLLCSFGENDCTIGEGIVKHVRKTGGDLETVVADEVRRYVRRVVRIAGQRRLQLFFLGVPAPRPTAPAAGDMTVGPDDRRLHAAVVASFNRHLHRAATDSGCAYVDVYGLTAGPGGFTRGTLHLDPIRLRPDALRRAAIHLLGTKF